MATSLAAIPLILICCVIAVLIPVVLCVYTYKDAKKRGQNAALWTVIVFFTGLVGLLIYVLIRPNAAALKCPNCGAAVNEGSAACPQCGTSFKKSCTCCGYPLENEWRACPNCSAPAPEGAYYAAPVREEVKSGSSKKTILIIVAIAAVLCLLATGIIFAGVMFMSRTNADNNYSSVLWNDIEKSDFKSSEIQEWFNDCDKNGKGAYILTSEDEMDSRKTSTFLIYINDKNYSVNDVVKESLFNSSESEISFQLFEPSEEDIKRDYTLCYYAYTANKRLALSRLWDLTQDDSGDLVEYQQTNDYSLGLSGIEAPENHGEDIDNPPFDLVYDFDGYAPLELADDVEIDLSILANDIKAVTCRVYLSGNEEGSRTIERKDGSDIYGKVEFEFDDDDCMFNEFSFSLADKDGNVVYESEIYKIDKSRYSFTVGYADHETNEITIL